MSVLYILTDATLTKVGTPATAWLTTSARAPATAGTPAAARTPATAWLLGTARTPAIIGTPAAVPAIVSANAEKSEAARTPITL